MRAGISWRGTDREERFNIEAEEEEEEEDLEWRR
jgi:hypothetical protein